MTETSDHTPARDSVTFRLSSQKPMRALLGGVAALAVAGVWVLIERGGEGALLTLGLGLVIFAYWNWQSGREKALAEADRSPKLTIDVDGVTIPDLFSRQVPWSAIDKLAFYSTKGGAYLSLSLETPEAFGFEPNAVQRLARSIGDTSVSYDYEPLDCDREQLRAALRRFAPARLAGDLE